MYKICLSTLLAIFLTLTVLQPTYTCGLFDIDCFFGWTERVEIKQHEETERARIQAQTDQYNAGQQTEQERIQAVQAEREAVTRLQQTQLETMRDQNNMLTLALTAKQLAELEAQTTLAQTTLQEQSDIAVAGINRTATTTQIRVMARTVVTLAVLAVMWYGIFVYVRKGGRHESGSK